MKKPRLTDEERIVIESMLRTGRTVYAIAKTLSRPVTTITREIKARAVESDKGAAYREGAVHPRGNGQRPRQLRVLAQDGLPVR